MRGCLRRLLESGGTWGIVEEAGGLKLGWLGQVVRALTFLLSGSASTP